MSLTIPDTRRNSRSRGPFQSRCASLVSFLCEFSFHACFAAAVAGLALACVHSRTAWRTWWFYLICLTLAATLAGTLYILRVRRTRRGFAAVLAERERVAREMHDTLIQGCTGVSVLLEALAGRNAARNDTENELLNLARQQTVRTIDEARQAVWSLRQPPDARIDLIKALRAIAEQTTRESGITVQLRHNTATLDISGSLANEITMTVREAVVNATRHSGSNRVIVDLAQNESELKVTIQDFGCGIREPAAGMHYGMIGMRERMQRLGGTVEIENSLDGTNVRLHLLWKDITEKEIIR